MNARRTIEDVIGEMRHGNFPDEATMAAAARELFEEGVEIQSNGSIDPTLARELHYIAMAELLSGKFREAGLTFAGLLIINGVTPSWICALRDILLNKMPGDYERRAHEREALAEKSLLPKHGLN